jgi:hypothetical protein
MSDYVLNDTSGLTQTNSESGTPPGGSWNTNHTFTSNSRLKDDAGYTRSSTGISGNGNLDSYRFASDSLTSNRNGSETVGAVTTTFNESYFEKSSADVSDKGTYGLSPTGKTPSGHIDGNHMYILSTNSTTTIVVNGGGVNTTETRAGNHLLQKTATDGHDYAPGGSVTGGLYQYNVMDNATTTYTLTGTIAADGCSETIDDGSSGTQMYTYNDQEQYGNGSGSGVAKLKNVVDGSVASDRVLTCPGLVRHTMASGTHHVELTDDLVYTITAATGGTMGPGAGLSGGAMSAGGGLNGTGTVTVHLTDAWSLEVIEDVSGPYMRYHRERLDSETRDTLGSGTYTVTNGQRTVPTGTWTYSLSWHHKEVISGEYCSLPGPSGPGSGCQLFGPIVLLDDQDTIVTFGDGMLPMTHPAGEPVGGGGGDQGGQAAGTGEGAAGTGVGQPGFFEGLIPVWGSARAAIDDCQNGRYGWCAFNAGMAVSDVVMVGAAVKGGFKAVKAGVKGLIGWFKDDAAKAVCKVACDPACFTAGHQIVVVLGDAAAVGPVTAVANDSAVDPPDSRVAWWIAAFGRRWRGSAANPGHARDVARRATLRMRRTLCWMPRTCCRSVARNCWTIATQASSRTKTWNGAPAVNSWACSDADVAWSELSFRGVELYDRSRS